LTEVSSASYAGHFSLGKAAQDIHRTRSGWPPELVWTQCRRQKVYCRGSNKDVSCSASSQLLLYLDNSANYRL